MKKLFTLKIFIFIFLVSGSKAWSQSCAPLQAPTLMGYTVTSTNLLINWQGTTVYTGCADVIDVEIKCASTGFFSGNAAYTYTSVAVTHSSIPYAYPTMSINIASFCPGTIYQFRAHERINSGTTFGMWTSTSSFTTQGSFSAPTYTLFASQDTINPCPTDTSYLYFMVGNTCNSSTANYTWTPFSGLSCANCAYPSATPSVTTIYTVSAAGNQLSCWAVSNKTIQVVVASCVGINELSVKNAFKTFPNPVTNILYISNEKYFEQPLQMEITNSLGQAVLKQPYKNEVDVSTFARGYYTLKISSGDGKQFYSKFLKE